jgi:hypothetical protein
MTPRPAPGATLFFLGEEGVLFTEPRQELHRFNTMAAVIWCHLEDGLAPAAIAAELAAGRNLDLVTAQDFVAGALADWATKGLLEGAPPPEPPEKLPAGAPAPVPGPRFLSAGRYRLLDTVIGVRCTHAAQRALITPILGHLRTRRPAQHAIDVVAVGGGFVVYRDGAEAGRCEALDQLAPVVKHLVWRAALEVGGFLADIHAGVVAGPAGCVLLPAMPGSGKSTLTAALVHAGFTYFSDEVALLRASDMAVRPFPVAICVKEPGIAPLRGMFPELPSLPVHNRSDGKRVIYLPPPRGSLPPAGAAQPVRALVFPHYQAGAATQWQDMTAAEALQRLLAQWLYVPGRLTLAQVKALVAWIAAVPAADLTYASLPDAIAMIAPRLGRAAGA